MASSSDPAHKSLKNSELLNSGMLFVRLWQTMALALHTWTSKLLIRGIHSTWIHVLVCFHSCLILAPGQPKRSFTVFGGTPSLSQCCSSLDQVSNSSLPWPIQAGIGITVALVGIQRPRAIFWIADSLIMKPTQRTCFIVLAHTYSSRVRHHEACLFSHLACLLPVAPYPTNSLNLKDHLSFIKLIQLLLLGR